MSKIQDAWARWKLGHFFVRDLMDVDVVSNPPTSGQALAWNSTDKKWEPASVGGFDPNETPVIIGSGATAGGGSTPSTVTGGAARATIVGPGATYTLLTARTDPTVVGSGAAGKGYRCVAVGYGSQAIDDDTTAVGPSSSAFTFGDSALGKNSQATGGKDTAIGFGASATGGTGVAIGANATVGALHGNSSAIGAGAATTAANQIMLGTSAETVVMWNFDGSNLPTTNPGAGTGLVWNSAGTLKVA